MYVRNNSVQITMFVAEPRVITLHEDGTLQIFDLNLKTTIKHQVTILRPTFTVADLAKRYRQTVLLYFV